MFFIVSSWYNCTGSSDHLGWEGMGRGVFKQIGFLTHIFFVTFRVYFFPYVFIVEYIFFPSEKKNIQQL